MAPAYEGPVTEPQGPRVVAEFPGLLGPIWRREHARAGDEALELAELALADPYDGRWHHAQAWAAVAQAHYAAANVRERA